LWVTLPETQTQTKINAAYVTGLDEKSWPKSVRPTSYQSKTAGGELAKNTLSQVVGFPIQYYVAVSFAGFTSAINNLGGITVKVPMSFTDNFYPIEGMELATCDKSDEEIKSLTATMSGFQLEQQFPCRYEKLALTAGVQTLDASTSLKFVRSRHSEGQGNDFNRSLRQQAFIQGVKQKLLEPSFWPKIPNLAKQLIKNVDTDLNLAILSGWLTTFPNPDQYQLYSYSLNPETGLVASRSADRQFILVPAENIGWEGIKAQIAAWETVTATRSSQFGKSAVQSSP
jgi:anionic cell wall polymer biosynthesis LytR-Cps2A-Psr (LCP) family protein